MAEIESRRDIRALPDRAEIDDRYKWRLDDLFPDEAAWEEAYRRVESRLSEAERHRGRTTESADALLACLRWLEALDRELSRVYVYAMLRRDEDTTCARAQAFYDRASGLRARVLTATSFVRPEILAAPAEHVRGLIGTSSELRTYAHHLDDILRQKDHVLPAEIESILAQGTEIARVPHEVFTMLNDADLTFPTIVDEDGTEIELTKGRYLTLLQRKDRRVRRDTFQAFADAYWRVRNTFAATLSGAVKVNLFNARVRGYPSALAAALDQEAVDPSVYENLIRTVGERLEPLHRYHRIRKRLLAVDALRPYDLHVPIVPKVDFKLSYEEATEIVQQALRPLGDEYGAALRAALDGGWIDVHESRGKRAGAYSTGGAHGAHPYILMNWQDDLDSLFTLAHELGHAMHSYFSEKHQPHVYADYAIFVAEVASTVNEGLLVHELLGRYDDPARRAYILNHYLDDFRGTIYTQVLFAEFEQRVHDLAAAGRALTAELLTETYRGLCEKYWGPDVETDERSSIFWARIPHFYYGFYVYKYATGFASATSIVARLLEGDAGAVERYLAFLASGGSDYPLNLLKKAGVDLTSPEPIVSALNRFDRLLGNFDRGLTG